MFPEFDRPTILDRIVEQTKEDLIRKKKKIKGSDFRGFPGYSLERRDFRKAIHQENKLSIIAEVKKASPSKGVIRADFHPLKIAEQYVEAGASALSILTEPFFFQGSLDYLIQVRQRFGLPLLRKDFIVDFYQVEEARAYGADAILLIAGTTDGNQLNELHHAAHEAGLQCLVECYGEDEFRSLDFETVEIVGVNNRNLKTFEVDLHRGIALLETAPGHVTTVSESGLSHPDDLKRLMDHGIHAALIGEHFMRQPNPGDALKMMLDEIN